MKYINGDPILDIEKKEVFLFDKDRDTKVVEECPDRFEKVRSYIDRKPMKSYLFYQEAIYSDLEQFISGETVKTKKDLVLNLHLDHKVFSIPNNNLQIMKYEPTSLVTVSFDDVVGNYCFIRFKLEGLKGYSIGFQASMKLSSPH